MSERWLEDCPEIAGVGLCRFLLEWRYVEMWQRKSATAQLCVEIAGMGRHDGNVDDLRKR